MAVLKHLSSKSSDYEKALEYLMYQHNEMTQEPIRNDRGQMMLREEFYLDGLNCSPSSFAKECELLNRDFHKNQKYSEVKSHHYILSFDPRDKAESGLTGVRAQTLGLEFAKRFFPGHQALVCTHMDGHNGSGNIHVHIVINSLRKLDVEPQAFMERLCDSRAGYKHNQTRNYLTAMQKGLMEITEREHLHQVDLLKPAPIKITEREYWKKRREETRLSSRHASSEKPADERSTQSTFQTQKQFIRDAVSAVSTYVRSLEGFNQALFENYGITVKTTRGRSSYLHPDREKYIRAAKLGADYDRDHILQAIGVNEKTAKRQSTISEISRQTAQKDIPSQREYDPSYDYDSDPIAILYVRSNLRLVVDLQTNIKAQMSEAYAQQVKISNLKEMAKTVCYVQEHGYDNRNELSAAVEDIAAKLSNARKTLRSTEDHLNELSEQIHYVGMYYTNKAVKADFLKARNKAKYRNEHQSELEAYENGVKYIKEHFDATVPSIKALKAEKAQYSQMKTAQTRTYQYFRDYHKELQTACSNVDAILGRSRVRDLSKSKGLAIS